MLLWLMNLDFAGGDGAVDPGDDDSDSRQSSSRMSRKYQRPESIGNRPKKGNL